MADHLNEDGEKGDNKREGGWWQKIECADQIGDKGDHEEEEAETDGPERLGRTQRPH